MEIIDFISKSIMAFGQRDGRPRHTMFFKQRLRMVMIETLIADTHPRWLLGQIVSILALGLCIAGFANKDDNKLLLILIAANAAFAMQFALLGSWVASGITCIVIVRILLARLFHRNLYIMCALLIATMATALIGWKDWTDSPALLAGILGTIGMFAFRGIAMRWWLLVAAFCWVLSNIVAGSIGGVIAEGFIMMTNLITIWRLTMDKRRATVPFK